MREVFITTFDNPFDYFKQFDDWLAFDRQMGYYTLEYLGRIIKTSNELSDEDFQKELESTIDEIIEWNGRMYKKVYSESLESEDSKESKESQNNNDIETYEDNQTYGGGVAKNTPHP